METHALESGQGRRHLECMLLGECAWAVDDIVFVFSHFHLGSLADINADQVEVANLLPNRLRHMLV